MSWLLNLHPVDHPRVDDVHLFLGRAAYVAAQFDRDVASLAVWLELPAVWSEFRTWSPEQIEEFQIAIARRVLSRRLQYTTHELRANLVEVDLLAKARKARNSLFHEMPRFPLHVQRGWGSPADLSIPANPTEHSTRVLVDAVGQVRPWVTSLTPGCALVGSWLFQFREQETDQPFPHEFFDAYAEQLAWWILAPVWDLLPTTEPAPPSDGAIRPKNSTHQDKWKSPEGRLN